MNSGKIVGVLAALSLAATARAVVPEVGDVSMTQVENRDVTISYTLSAPGVVTLDIEIGRAHV